MKTSLLLGLMIQFASAQTLDPSQVLQFPVAKDGLTRISIENDGIDDIYYPADLADNIQHHKSGHVFIMADDVEGPMYVTLVTKRGVAQDLKLTPTRKTAAPILLKFETEETKVQEIQDQIPTLLKSFIQGSVPLGFYPIIIDEVSRTASALTAVMEQGFQNTKFRVLVFEVKSENGKHTLDSKTLWAEGDLAIAFDQPNIEEGQSAKMFVIQKL
jgi:hypothetical protein